MFAVGVAKLCLLSALAMVAALSVAVRGRFEGRAETAAAAGLLWNAIVLTPIYALGLTNRLTATSLGLTSAAFSVAVLFASMVGRRPREVAADVAREALAIARMPFEALRDAWVARSVVLVGLVFSVVLILWTGLTSYYSPSWRQWDALWYHEPIIAFTIQNHGFAVVDLPQTGLQKINGYPRLCEMTQLWFVIFTDRRLIEIANSFLAPLFMLVVYLLAQRQARTRDFTKSRRVASMGWAARC